MVDLNEHTMMFTLNGEVLLDDSGSELAFKDFETGEGQDCASNDTNRSTHTQLSHTCHITVGVRKILQTTWRKSSKLYYTSRRSQPPYLR